MCVCVCVCVCVRVRWGVWAEEACEFAGSSKRKMKVVESGPGPWAGAELP